MVLDRRATAVMFRAIVLGVCSVRVSTRIEHELLLRGHCPDGAH